MQPSGKIWMVVWAGVILLAGCNFAPSYLRPQVSIPANFKELKHADLQNTEGWKDAEPKEHVLRGKWWEVFGDPQLKALEEEGNASNQSVAAAFANFLAARAVVKQSRSLFFPTVTTTPSVTKSGGRQGTSVGGTNVTNNGNSATLYSLPFDATWELDFWGRIKNTVQANARTAEAGFADLENLRLTVESEVAVNYFQIRALDGQKQLFESAVVAFRESLELTKARFQTGIASDQDVAQAEAQLNTTQVQATDLGIQRAQLEHAIAVLIGKSPSMFYIPIEPLQTKPQAVPFDVPSTLLERRPDIAAAERRVAAANAQIGIARAAYFPTVTLSGSAGFQSSTIANLVSGPSLAWSVGGNLAETLFDAGRRRGVTEQAWANYQNTVANYRQTVLSAFQEVEDNLSTLRILSQEIREQAAAVQSSQRFLTLANDRYKLGIDSYLNVITAQTTLLNNQRIAVNLRGLQMTATVQLVKALGGGWQRGRLQR
ncbi:MAG: efflux system, outer rane lipoprotein NodT family [Verrucomicrobiales bacterium]|nr:efflux system, outer rane lipoprotein NodT family [Verrucomicrobiales bacterium]